MPSRVKKQNKDAMVGFRCGTKIRDEALVEAYRDGVSLSKWIVSAIELHVRRAARARKRRLAAFTRI